MLKLCQLVTMYIFKEKGVFISCLNLFRIFFLLTKPNQLCYISSLSFQIRIPPHDHCVYETREYETEPPTQNGGLSPQFANKIHVGGANTTSADNCEQQFMKVLKKVYQTIERNEIRLQEQDRKDLLKQEWHQLTLVIDRLLFLVFIIVTITVTLVVFIPQD